MTTDAGIRDRLRAALLSPELTLVGGIGDAEEPGQGETCTIAEINLVLTGRLTDDPHPCMSEVIRAWTIAVQDGMPDDVRNSTAWREAAVGIAGSAASADVERRRLDAAMGWMWAALADEAVLAAVPADTRPLWARMLEERSAAAAAGADVGDRTDSVIGKRLAHVAAVALCAITYADAGDIADAARSAAIAASGVADAAIDPGGVASYWARRDPAGLLTRLVAVD